MRQAQTYKPSNTFSFAGFILMFISMLVAGALLSWLYVVLQAVIPLIYLCILITIGFGAAIGGIGALFVKVYKIRHPGLAVAATLIAMLFVYLFHWCVYVARDYDEHTYKSMKLESAAEYFMGVSERELYELDAATTAQAIMAYYKAAKISEIKFTALEKEYFNSKQKSMYDRNASIWEFYDYDNTLGTTVSEVAESINAMKGMNAYDFYIDYRKQPEHSIGYLLVHPGELWDDINTINSVGRWTMRSSRSSSSRNVTTVSSTNNNVNGVMLWIVWFGEMLLMFIPAVAIIRSRAGAPFIEQDNDWAVTDKPQLSFKFIDPFPGNSSGEKQFKSVFMNDIDSLFTLQPLLPQMGSLNTYYTVTYCHSKFYTENYLTVMHTKVNNARNNQRVNSNIAKMIQVDADYIATLHAMFGYPVPQGCPGVNRFAQQQTYQQPQGDYQYQQAQQTAQQPQDNYQYQQTQQQNYDQLVYQQSQQDPFSSGDMDGIDTSNIDTSSLDNMNK